MITLLIRKEVWYQHPWVKKICLIIKIYIHSFIHPFFNRLQFLLLLNLLYHLASGPKCNIHYCCKPTSNFMHPNYIRISYYEAIATTLQTTTTIITCNAYAIHYKYALPIKINLAYYRILLHQILVLYESLFNFASIQPTWITEFI